MISREGTIELRNAKGHLEMRSNGQVKVNTPHDFTVHSKQAEFYPITRFKVKSGTIVELESGGET